MKLADYINLIHESIEGRYDLTGQDLIEIHDLLVDANLKAYQMSRTTEDNKVVAKTRSKPVPNIGAEEYFKEKYGHSYNVPFDSIEVIKFATQFASQSQGESEWVDMKELFTTIRGVIAMSNGSP